MEKLKAQERGALEVALKTLVDEMDAQDRPSGFHFYFDSAIGGESSADEAETLAGVIEWRVDEADDVFEVAADYLAELVDDPLLAVEASWYLEAVVADWRRIADACPIGSREGIRLRVLASELDHWAYPPEAIVEAVESFRARHQLAELLAGLRIDGTLDIADLAASDAGPAAYRLADRAGLLADEEEDEDADEDAEEVPPKMSEAERILAMIQALRPKAETECRRCGRPIGMDAGGRWTHVGDHGRTDRGCRAASFEPGQGWDDTLPRTWQAAPPKS
jgi:hypothetical protein